MMVADRLITVREAAERFDVTVDTVRRWIKQSKILAYKRGTGNGYMVEPSSIERLFELRPVDEEKQEQWPE